MFLTEYDEKEAMRRLARDERQEGREEGRMELLTQLTKEGLITEEIGAQKAGMELSNYRKAIEEYSKKAASRVSDNTGKPE